MDGLPLAPSSRPRHPLPGSRWSVQLLGDFRVCCGNIDKDVFPDKPSRLLFVCLALRPRFAFTKDELALILWPGIASRKGVVSKAAAKTGRERLIRSLSRLKGHLRLPGLEHAPPFVDADDHVQLNATAFDIDTAHFEGCVDRRQWAVASAAYRGALLPGMSGEWLEKQRARLAALRGRVDIERAAAAAAGLLDESDIDAPPFAAGAAAAAGLLISPYITHFFGRETELQALQRAVAAHRLVTLTGAGGSGKTRLANVFVLQVNGFDTVPFVSLADSDAASDIVERLRAALELKPADGPTLKQIADHLKGRRTLLVLDNFEQLVGKEGDAALDQLLQALPGAQCLVTSRRALRRADECVVEVLPLPLPGAEDDLATATCNPGVALFVDRAKAARRDFNLGQRNFRNVLEICRLLDGVPMAIELAAAHIRTLGPHEMARKLTQSLRLHAGPQMRLALPGRHASVDAMLAWSWALLKPAERELLRCLSVFHGGWTPGQAAAVSGIADAASSLDALARDSLVRAMTTTRSGPRLVMLDLLREFVQTQLDEVTAAAWRRRHREHFLALAVAVEAGREWPDEADLPNLTQALASAVAAADAHTAAALGLALAGPWRARGASHQVCELLQQAAQMPGMEAPQRVPLQALLAALLTSAGHFEPAHAHAALALKLAGANPALRAEALLAQADVHWRSTNDGALPWPMVQEAKALLQPLPTGAVALQRLRGRLLLMEGALTLRHLKQPAAAALIFEQAEHLFLALGDRRAAVLALPGRTACMLAEQRWQEAIRVSEKGEQLAAELGDVVTRLQLCDRLNNAFEGTEQFERALHICQHQTRIARVHGLAYYAAFGAWNQCHPLAQSRQPETAARLLAFTIRLWAEQGGRLDAKDKRYVRQVRDLIRSQIGDTRLRKEWLRGRALSRAEGLDLAAGKAPKKIGRAPGL